MNIKIEISDQVVTFILRPDARHYSMCLGRRYSLSRERETGYVLYSGVVVTGYRTIIATERLHTVL
jgi:hypothetical protein